MESHRPDAAVLSRERGEMNYCIFPGCPAGRSVSVYYDDDDDGGCPGVGRGGSVQSNMLYIQHPKSARRVLFV